MTARKGEKAPQLGQNVSYIALPISLILKHPNIPLTPTVLPFLIGAPYGFSMIAFSLFKLSHWCQLIEHGNSNTWGALVAVPAAYRRNE